MAPNRLNREFLVDTPDRIWVGDVTFIPTRTGWLYLSVLIDLYSRKVVGWAMGNKNNGALVHSCLDMAIAHRQLAVGLLHHSDRGATYAMSSYRETLKAHGMNSSMSRKKDCWDNAVAESFFSTLKYELTYWRHFNNQSEARSAIFEYIEVFYNRQRLHQTLNYVSPYMYEKINGVA